MLLTYAIGDNEFQYEVDGLDSFIKSLGQDVLIDFILDNIDDNHIKEFQLPSNPSELQTILNDDSFLVLELIDSMEDAFFEEFMEDILDYYEDEAMEAYNDYKEYSNNPYGYYGLNRSDFR